MPGPWAGPRRAALAPDVRMIRDRIGTTITRNRGSAFEPAAPLRIAQSDAIWWSYGSVVIWRVRLTGADTVVTTPEGVPAPTADRPWWLELLSIGFDQDAAGRAGPRGRAGAGDAGGRDGGAAGALTYEARP